jgi:hypothetical protein
MSSRSGRARISSTVPRNWMTLRIPLSMPGSRIRERTRARRARRRSGQRPRDGHASHRPRSRPRSGRRAGPAPPGRLRHVVGVEEGEDHGQQRAAGADHRDGHRKHVADDRRRCVGRTSSPSGARPRRRRGALGVGARAAPGEVDRRLDLLPGVDHRTYNCTGTRRWRNGRLDGLKIHCPKGRVGSNPTRRIATGRVTPASDGGGLARRGRAAAVARGVSGPRRGRPRRPPRMRGPRGRTPPRA